MEFIHTIIMHLAEASEPIGMSVMMPILIVGGIVAAGFFWASRRQKTDRT